MSRCSSCRAKLDTLLQHKSAYVSGDMVGAWPLPPISASHCRSAVRRLFRANQVVNYHWETCLCARCFTQREGLEAKHVVGLPAALTTPKCWNSKVDQTILVPELQDRRAQLLLTATSHRAVEWNSAGQIPQHPLFEQAESKEEVSKLPTD